MPQAPTAPDPHELLALAERAARLAGALLLDGLGRRRTLVAQKSTATDMVTEMDHAAEEAIVACLLAARPHDGVRGEEGTERTGTSGVEWVVDPLDGTTDYLYGHPGFGVSLAARLGGRTVAGAVFDPVHDEAFTAVAGGGAHRNGEAIRVSDTSELDRALVATGFSYDPRRRWRQAAVLVDVLPRVRDIRRMGAAAVDLCWVACGRVDAFYERGLQPWDHAAGALVAAEAGAVVGDLDGGPASEAFVLAAPPALFGPLADLLSASGAGTA